jgi:hypothetical protein
MHIIVAPAQPTSPSPPVRRFSALSSALTIVCGILLPAITLLVEAVTHMCADVFFDPLPTVAHVFAVAAVPFANLASLWTLRRRETARLEAATFAQAFAVGVSGVYAVLFVPITPMAAYGVLFWGLGLLPLSPLLSLIAGLRVLLALRAVRCAPGRLVIGGLAAGVGLLIALNIPAAVTPFSTARPASDAPSARCSQIAWLHRWSTALVEGRAPVR